MGYDTPIHTTCSRLLPYTIIKTSQNEKLMREDYENRSRTRWESIYTSLVVYILVTSQHQRASCRNRATRLSFVRGRCVRHVAASTIEIDHVRDGRRCMHVSRRSFHRRDDACMHVRRTDVYTLAAFYHHLEEFKWVLHQQGIIKSIMYAANA